MNDRTKPHRSLGSVRRTRNGKPTLASHILACPSTMSAEDVQARLAADGIACTIGTVYSTRNREKRRRKLLTQLRNGNGVHEPRTVIAPKERRAASDPERDFYRAVAQLGTVRALELLAGFERKLG